MTRLNRQINLPAGPAPALPPDSIGEYRISRALTPGQTFLAMGAGDRQVTLKMLEADCLQRDHLHPSIHQRLARVRELAHASVANLQGVERADGQVFCIWEFVPGKAVNQHVETLTSERELAHLFREMILSIESLHALGIVHGRIHAGNVIVDPIGRVHLTHISPLLYDDPAGDLADLTSLLRDLAASRGWADSSLIKSLTETASLTQLRLRLSTSQDETFVENISGRSDNEPSARKKPLLAAAVATLIAVAIVLGVMKWAQHKSAPKITPPEAPSQAMNP